MAQHKFLNDIYTKVVDEMTEIVCNDDKRYIEVCWYDKTKRGSGDIYVSINENDEVNVFVVHSTCEEDVDTRLTNIIEAVKGVVPTWDEIVEQCKEDAIWADEWQRNGFRNAADYNHYRYANW